MSAEGYYANRNSPKPPWVSTIELTSAGGGKKGEVVQGSYKGKCSCNRPPRERVCVTAARNKDEATLEVMKKVPMCPAADLAVALPIPLMKCHVLAVEGPRGPVPN